MWYNNHMKSNLPQAVKACLWSYDTEQIDLNLPNHRTLVIVNVLDRGTNEAVVWLRATFSETEISEVIVKSSASDWSKKSLALWSLVFNAYPAKVGRFV